MVILRKVSSPKLGKKSYLKKNKNKDDLNIIFHPFAEAGLIPALFGMWVHTAD